MQWKRSTILPGQRYGRLVVIEEDSIRHRASIRWICQCDCGNTTAVISTRLRNSHTRSCGCGVGLATIARNTTHGMGARSSKTPEYKVWQDIRRRCLNPKAHDYRYYGGRGITICPEWDDFTVFLRDMGPRPSSEHSIDRVDNDGPYSAANCRWATRTTQGRNKRNNVWLTHDGKTLTLTEWSRMLEIPASRLTSRLRSGWTVEEILSTTDRTYGPRRKKPV